MQSWMIGLVSGIVAVGFWPVLPPWPVLLLFGAAALTVTFRRTPICAFLAGFSLGCVLGCVHGELLLHTRIAQSCVGLPLTVTGTVSSLPRDSLIRAGVPRQRFEFTVKDLQPMQCAGPKHCSCPTTGTT